MATFMRQRSQPQKIQDDKHHEHTHKPAGLDTLEIHNFV
jgi:hypothetical protein